MSAHQEDQAQLVNAEEFLRENPDIAQDIIALSAQESMVPITEDSLRRHHVGVVAVRDSGEFAGYTAVTHVYSQHTVELGGLLVPPELRGRGIAQSLVHSVVERAHQEMEVDMILAFSNQDSANIFRKLGGRVVPNPEILPSEVWKVCHSCRFFEEAVIKGGENCCGRVYDITDINHE